MGPCPAIIRSLDKGTRDLIYGLMGIETDRVSIFSPARTSCLKPSTVPADLMAPEEAMRSIFSSAERIMAGRSFIIALPRREWSRRCWNTRPHARRRVECFIAVQLFQVFVITSSLAVWWARELFELS